ncbi:unnamed protein product [Oncorhynchus mykiss]|uniref:BESS domain-containing protein n=1 Tax=Oncorhynchus mykiss TaxID=8022 RepID=A0A060W072_ONCMY|nr:unnamed protein product [Oncorhynchus mykiss]
MWPWRETERNNASSEVPDPDPLNSFQQRLLQAVEKDAAQPDAHRKEDEETLFAMSLVPTLKRLPQQRKAAVKDKMYPLLFEAEFNEMSPFSRPAHRKNRKRRGVVWLLF